MLVGTVFLHGRSRTLLDGYWTFHGTYYFRHSRNAAAFIALGRAFSSTVRRDVESVGIDTLGAMLTVAIGIPL
jgi:cytosine/uracil/thiamine/allantoin permease